jgi:hypothetical protein
LHLGQFRFSSFFPPYDYDLELTRAPDLHSVTARWNYRDNDGREDYTREAVLDMAAGVAPNLRCVRLVRHRYPASAALGRNAARGMAFRLNGSHTKHILLSYLWYSMVPSRIMKLRSGQN